MKWGFLLGVAVVQSDRPEIKDDASDVIVSEISHSMMNVSNARSKFEGSVGQITTCTWSDEFTPPKGYWTDSREGGPRTLHRFDKGQYKSDLWIYEFEDAYCNAKVMPLLASKDCGESFATEGSRIAVHSEYVILNDEAKTFLVETTQLIESSSPFTHNKFEYVCGYLTGQKQNDDDKHIHYHLWQNFIASTDANSAAAFDAWKNKRQEAYEAGFKWIKPANVVNQPAPEFFPFDPFDVKNEFPVATSADHDMWTSTLKTMKEMQINGHALWIFCSREADTGAELDKFRNLDKFKHHEEDRFSEHMFFFEKIETVTHDMAEVHGLKVSESEINKAGDEITNCRNTHMRVVAVRHETEVLPAETGGVYLFHSEYEIPFTGRDDFVTAFSTYLEDSTNIVHGFLMSNNVVVKSNNRESEEFIYYHIGMVLKKKVEAGDKITDPKWNAFTQARAAAAEKGHDWTKPDLHSNRKSPNLTPV